jgi:transcriptional regulator with XRE-family HTH domain
MGVLLRDARTRADKTKSECAAVLGVSTRTITAFEEGRKPISLPELEVLAFFLDVPVDHFWNQDAQLLPSEQLPPVQEVMKLRNRIIGALLKQARLDAGKSQKELGQLVGCSSRRISAYEYGERAIPLPELEVLTEHLDLSIDHFLDQKSGPVGEWEKEKEAYEAFLQLPEEIREFIVKPINWSYLDVAMKLAHMPAGSIRGIAEGLLDITY